MTFEPEFRASLAGRVKVTPPIECPICHAPLLRVWWRHKTWRCRNRGCGWSVQIRVIRRGVR